MYEDQMTHAQAVMSTDHAYIHKKLGFSLAFNTGSLAGDALYKATLRTPAKSTGKVVHLRPSSLSATANAMQLSVYEDSVSTSGTVAQLLNHFREENPVVAKSTLKLGTTVALTGKNHMAATAGGGFANQPAGSKVTIVSDNNVEDKIPTLTVYGTKTGATATVSSEVMQLNGTTAVDSVITTWQNILGLELSAACTGTITVKDGAGNTIITITAGDLTRGIATITDSRGRDQVLIIIASDTSTSPVGVIGTNPDGDAISSVKALNGASSVNLNTDVFRTITKILIGAPAANRNITVSRPEVLMTHVSAGAGGGSTASRSGGNNGENDEWILEPDTDYVFVITNGSVTESTAYVNLFFYEEPFQS
jgi:hypothetical protein